MSRPRTLTDDKADEILQRIIDGESQASIAKDVGVSPAALSDYLAQDHLAERSARAREMSAEAWLDKGIDTIASALDKSSGIDATAARAYAQECARRAAIRNPRYSDKLQLQHSGKINSEHTLTTSELMAIAAKARGGDAGGTGGGSS